MLLYSRTGDVWWPKLSADGRFVAFGGGGLPDAPPAVRVVHLASGKEVAFGLGRAIHWIGPNQVTWLVDRDGNRAERWHATIMLDGDNVTAMNVSRTPDDTALAAGNEFAAANGHWASWLAEGRRLVYDGRVLSNRARGVKMAGDYLLYVEDDTHFVRVWHGSLSVRLPLPPTANEWTISADGTIGYGYWGPARILQPDGGDFDVTVTPWRQEGVPRVVTVGGIVWAWTATVRPDGRGIVLGRPAGSLDCIILDPLPAVSIDIAVTDRDFIVAGCDDTGHLHVHRTLIDTPRRLVPAPTPAPDPDPIPDPIPDPPKETPVQLEQRHVDLIFKFAAKFPCPGHNEDELREKWTPRLIGQLAYTFPRDGWGWKARDRNAPHSSDVICRRIGDHTYGWDIIPGAGSSNWELDPRAGQESMNLDDQFYFTVPAKNYIDEAPKDPEEPTDPTDPGPVPAEPTDLTPVIREFDETQNALTQLVMAITMLGDACNRVGDIVGRIEAHDLIIADLLRQNVAAVTDLRKRLDMAIKVRL